MKKLRLPKPPTERSLIDHFLETFAAGGREALRIRSIIFVAITVPVIVLAAFSYIKTRSSFTEFTFLRRQSVAGLAASTLRTRFEQLQKIGTSVADNGAARFAETEDWDGLATSLVGLHLSLPELDSIIIADAEGTIVASQPKDLPYTIGQSAAHMDWYNGVRKNWQPYVSDIYKPLHFPDYNVIGIATPIHDTTGAVRGIMVMQLRADALLAWTTDIDAGAGAFIFFTDRQGRIGIHPLISPGAASIADYSVFSPVQRALDLERGVEILYDYRVGAEVVAAFEPVPRFGWVAIVEQPTRSAFSLRDEEATFVLKIYGIIFLLNGLVALFLIRTLSVVSTLRQREQAIVGSIGEGLIVTDHTGIIVRVNRAACLMLSMPETEMLSQHVEDVLWVYDERGHELLGHEDLPLIRGIEGNRVAGKFTFMTRKQHKFPVALTATPMSHNGRISGAVAIFRDITKEEELDRAKKEFISVASHELLTPVSASKAFLSMLLGGDFGKMEGQQKAYLEKLFELNQRMVELVDDLLNVSRLELGVLEAAAEPVDMSDIIQSEITQIMPLADARRISIDPQLGAEIPTVLLSPKLLRLVLQNLLSNAIKYTPDGGLVTVVLTRENDPAMGDSALLAVRDTGVGIPKDQQASIFSKFFRAENVREKEIAGTGLGLFIVHNIITLFKGKIWFDSVVDKGTTFYVRLPIKKMR